MTEFKQRLEHLKEKIEQLYGLLDRAVAVTKDLVKQHEGHSKVKVAEHPTAPVVGEPGDI